MLDISLGVGGGGLHSDVSSRTERRPCFRNYVFASWLYFCTFASKSLTVLQLAKICNRTIVTTETMRTNSEVRHPRCVGSITKNFSCITLTVEHYYISSSSTVGIQLHYKWIILSCLWWFNNTDYAVIHKYQKCWTNYLDVVARGSFWYIDYAAKMVKMLTEVRHPTHLV